MKKNKLIVTIFLFIIIIASLFYSIINKKNAGSTIAEPISKSGYFLDTLIDIKLYDNGTEEMIDEMFTILKDIEGKMSIHIIDSEVSTINSNSGVDAVKVSPDTLAVIQRGEYYSKLSNGNFDITVGPLVSLWNIGSDEAKLPTQNEIDKALNLIDYTKVTIDEANSTVKLEDENMSIDLGGIAKGYAADKLAEYLTSKNVKSALISLGGNIFALGSKANGEDWSIGIQNPFDTRGDYFAILKVSNKTVVTSGVYERFLEVDGEIYHHILSPFNGYPVDNNLMSVTIIADKSIDADGLSTTIFALGVDKGLELINSLDGVSAIFVTKDKEVYISSGVDNFSISNNEFKLMD
ncbi:FAD:protein FMN transferase [Clostridium grantii]|uniref:FAD:protein FMN transferase n=1 Tax=Clostridium grantii DSM 8605 TaxID=1121316 RepID=A0A1M5W5V5_9CLOT|nr:FAD:protein FMN transferase [Clostridium grantii]SHH82573.1 thiamine biosynthesis lipoprotein [Clostridium grantii DSM 8605]